MNTRVFISYARQDYTFISSLSSDLGDSGVRVWLDQRDSSAGKNWIKALENAMLESEFFIIILSRKSIFTANVLDTIQYATNKQKTIFPLVIEECEYPYGLEGTDRIDFTRDYKKALKILLARMSSAGIPVDAAPPPQAIALNSPFYLELIRVPAGDFIMGSDPEDDKHSVGRERPKHLTRVQDFYMAKFPITNAQYSIFVKQTHHSHPVHWAGRKIAITDVDLPVGNISWHDAMDFCIWLNKATKKNFRLPTEPEWEKAARGTDGRIYPWGNDWSDQIANCKEGGLGGPSAVGRLSPQSDSSYGIAELCGNVWEWTSSLWGKTLMEPYFRYPYRAEDGRENLHAPNNVYKIVKGGAFNENHWNARAAVRHRYFPGGRQLELGFRIVISLEDVDL